MFLLVLLMHTRDQERKSIYQIWGRPFYTICDGECWHKLQALSFWYASPPLPDLFFHLQNKSGLLSLKLNTKSLFKAVPTTWDTLIRGDGISSSYLHMSNIFWCNYTWVSGLHNDLLTTKPKVTSAGFDLNASVIKPKGWTPKSSIAAEAV